MNDTIDAKFKPTALAVRDDAALAPSSLFAAMRPAERMALAEEIATTMRAVLERGKPGYDANGKAIRVPLITKVPQKVKGELVGYSEHVHAEGWQTLATLCGVAARVVSTTKVGNGYEARAEAVRVENGVVIGAGEAICSKDESRGPWKYADEYAVKSMAQTRAISKALRGVLAWVIVLAGYNPTPAEEVPPGGFADASAPAPGPALASKAQMDEIKACLRAAGVRGTTVSAWVVKAGIRAATAGAGPLTVAEFEAAMAEVAAYAPDDGGTAQKADDAPKPTVVVSETRHYDDAGAWQADLAGVGPGAGRSTIVTATLPQGPGGPSLDDLAEQAAKAVQNDAQGRQKRALRKRIMAQCTQLYGKNADEERHRAMKLYRIGSLDDAHIDAVPMADLEALAAFIDLRVSPPENPRDKKREPQDADDLLEYAHAKGLL